jgi:hypothetical protein
LRLSKEKLLVILQGDAVSSALFHSQTQRARKVVGNPEELDHDLLVLEVLADEITRSLTYTAGPPELCFIFAVKAPLADSVEAAKKSS